MIFITAAAFLLSRHLTKRKTLSLAEIDRERSPENGLVNEVIMGSDEVIQSVDL